MTYNCRASYADAVDGENGEKRAKGDIGNALRDPGTGRFLSGNGLRAVNPGRKPEEWTWRKLIRQRLSDNPLEQQALLDALFAKGQDGDVRALETIFNRCDGLLTQPIGGDPTRPACHHHTIRDTEAA